MSGQPPGHSPGPTGPPPPGWGGPGPQQGQHPPQQSPYQGPPPGYLHLTVQGSAMTSNMVPPVVLIDGRQVPSGYGSFTFPLPPGQHHLSIYCQWLRRYGQAEMPLNIVPGQQVPVFYRGPLHQFTTGSIGHEPQKAKGKGCMFGALGFAVLVILVIVIGALLA
ncbi:hypothetical protein GCM10027599_03050 [Yimella radicis]